MTTFDWLLLLVLTSFMAFSIRRGAVYEALSVFFWLLAFYLAVLIGSLYAFSAFNNGAKVLRTGRTLSWVLGLVRGIIFLLAATVVTSMTKFKHQPWWRDSSGAKMLVTALDSIAPMLPRRVAEKMN